MSLLKVLALHNTKYQKYSSRINHIKIFFYVYFDYNYKLCNVVFLM